MTIEERKKMIVDNLRKARVEAGLTQQGLAKKTGCSCSLVGTYESLHQFMSFDTFLKLCDALNKEPYEMLFDSLYESMQRRIDNQAESIASYEHDIKAYSDKIKRYENIITDLNRRLNKYEQK